MASSPSGKDLVRMEVQLPRYLCVSKSEANMSFNCFEGRLQHGHISEDDMDTHSTPELEVILVLDPGRYSAVLPCCRGTTSPRRQPPHDSGSFWVSRHLNQVSEREKFVHYSYSIDSTRTCHPRCSAVPGTVQLKSTATRLWGGHCATPTHLVVVRVCTYSTG